MTKQYVLLEDAIDALRGRINANTSPAQRQMLKTAAAEITRCATADVVPEIRELEKGDTKDNEYAIAKQEAALKAACGKYYAPSEVRYDIKIVTRDGKRHKL